MRFQSGLLGEMFLAIIAFKRRCSRVSDEVNIQGMIVKKFFRAKNTFHFINLLMCVDVMSKERFEPKTLEQTSHL